jgi:hypothetical protein
MIQFSARGANLLLAVQDMVLIGEGALIADGHLYFFQHKRRNAIKIIKNNN